MKSPRVYYNNTFYLATIMGFITSLILIATTYDTMGIWQLIGITVVITGGLSLMGWFYRISTIYTRKVTHPVNPKSLVRDTTYYLNGEFEAQYLGRDGFTGKHIFEIASLGEVIDIYPGMVELYFSAQKEV